SATRADSRHARRVGLRDAAVELGNGFFEPGRAALVSRGLELPLEFGPRQPQRLECARLFGILRAAGAPFGALPLELFHPLLNPRLCVDEAFARITHVVPSRENVPPGSIVR